MGPGTNLKLIFVRDRPEIYGTTFRGIINQNVKEVGPESNSIPTEQVHKRPSTHPGLYKRTRDVTGWEAIDSLTV